MFNMKILFIVINAIRVSAHRREFLRIEHSCPELCFWQLFLLLDYKKRLLIYLVQKFLCNHGNKIFYTRHYTSIKYFLKHLIVRM